MSQRWKQWFEAVLNATSPTIDHSVIDLIAQLLPDHAPLVTEPSMEDVKRAVDELVSGKATGTDIICGEVLN
ncbi:unnamed protein product [Sphacelaria rigidula]